MYSVSSWFQVQLEDRTSEPKRQFLIGTSDYSDRVTKWPKIKRTANKFNSAFPMIKLDNADGGMNHFYKTTVEMVQECYLKLGFAVLTDNLKGYWPFDETSGSIAPDMSDNGGNGTLINMNNSDWVTGVKGNCLEFDGTSNCVFVDNDVDLRITGDISISAWIYLPNNSQTYIICAKQQEWDTNNQYDFGVFKDTGKLYFIRANSATWNIVYGNSPGTGAWKHVVVTQCGQDVSFYISGNSAGSGTMPITPTGSGDFFIGTGMQHGSFFLGKIDELRIYDKALSVKEIDILYNVFGEEMITCYTGNLKDVRYTNRECQIKTHDKLFDFSERKVGDPEDVVVFSETIPSDIAWILCSCYGELCASKSTGNADIDYTVFNAWANQFSADSIIVNAYYKGLKVTDALTRLCEMTDSAVWVEGDGKLNFFKSTEPDSNDLVLTGDNYTGIKIDIEQSRMTNKAYVYWDYDVESNYSAKVCVSQASLSVDSFGLHENIWEDDTIWYTNSLGALNFAERKTMLLKNPPKSFKIKTDLYAIRQQLGETIKFKYPFYGITLGAGWQLSEQELNMDTGEIKLTVDEALAANAFYLDVSHLDGDEYLL